MSAGVKTVNLSKTLLVDEVVGNRSGSTALIPANALALQMRASEPFADLVATGDTVTMLTWAHLASVAGTRDGQRGYVEVDSGNHVDPVVGGIVQNQGIYAWSVSPAGWRWLRKDDVSELESEVEAARNGNEALAGRLDAMVEASPLIDNFRNLEVDFDGRPTYGTTYDGADMQAFFGKMVQVNAPARTVALIDNFSDLELDVDGRIIRGTQYDGSIWRAVGGILTMIRGPEQKAGVTAYQWAAASYSAIPSEALTGIVDYGILSIDQSHFGLSHDAGDATVTTAPQHPGYALMPATGVFTRLNNTVYSYDAYADLKETEIPGSNGSYETVCSGMVDAILRRCQSRFGAKPRIIVSGSVRGGTAYKMLKRGSPWYVDVLRVAANNAAISAALGRRYEILCVTTNHGQQDWMEGISREEYTLFLTEWQQAFDHDLRAITGQSRPIKLYFNQSGYRSSMSVGVPNEPAIAQFTAPKRNPMLRFAGAPYQSLGSTDDSGGHYKASGFYHNGLLLGAAIFEGEWGYGQRVLECIDGWWVNSTQIRLKYNMPIALEVDDTVINISALGSGKGVDFTDGSATPPTVTGIAVSGDIYLNVTLSEAPTGKNPRVYVAARATDAGSGMGGTGALTGNRSAIRAATAFDTAPLTSVDLYQRAPMQEIILPVI